MENNEMIKKNIMQICISFAESVKSIIITSITFTLSSLMFYFMMAFFNLIDLQKATIESNLLSITEYFLFFRFPFILISLALMVAISKIIMQKYDLIRFNRYQFNAFVLLLALVGYLLFTLLSKHLGNHWMQFLNVNDLAVFSRLTYWRFIIELTLFYIGVQWIIQKLFHTEIENKEFLNNLYSGLIIAPGILCLLIIVIIKVFIYIFP